MDTPIIKVPNLKVLNSLPNHEQGEVAFCEEENKYYIYSEEWTEVKAEMSEDGGLKIDLYELNKQIVSQLNDFTEENVEELKTIISGWEGTKNNYFYMLYGREINYFTLFRKVGDEAEFDNFSNAIIECLQNIGTIKAYDITDGDAVEIWISNNEDLTQVTVLYLFPYDMAVVTYNE